MASETTARNEIEKKEGFAHVAQWLSRDTDNATLIYRKFGELSTRNLLYLQTELAILEKKLEDIDKVDAKSEDVNVKDIASAWEALLDRQTAGDQEAAKRLELIAKIRHKLKEYHEALLLENEVTKLRRPNNKTVEAYKYWFNNPVPVLGGQAKDFLNHVDDLAGLGDPPEPDYLSVILRRHWPVQKELSRDGRLRIGRFSEESISVAVAVINTVIAALLLVGPIIGLYFVKKDSAKLSMLAAFTAAFAVSVGLVTNAKRAEIFGATAAYAAVLVVFVSGDISNTSTPPVP